MDLYNGLLGLEAWSFYYDGREDDFTSCSESEKVRKAYFKLVAKDKILHFLKLRA